MRRTSARLRTRAQAGKENAASLSQQGNSVDNSRRATSADRGTDEDDAAKQRPKQRASGKRERGRDRQARVTVAAGHEEPAAKRQKAAETSSTAEARSCGRLVGAHVSIAGGAENAVTNAVALGASAFAVFTRNQRRWESKPLSPENAEAFRVAMKQHCFPAHSVVPHAGYLINMASADPALRERSRAAFLDEMQRCEMLGVTMLNFHPGSTAGSDISREQAIQHVADGINAALNATASCKAVIENMAGSGNVLGSTLEEIADIIAQVNNKDRVGVCIDTCHAFAAGYDVRTKQDWDVFWALFDKVIGRRYLCALHLNDSKGDLGCRTDRHEIIGRGCIGIECFRVLMQDPALAEIPMVLETPGDQAAQVAKLKDLM